MNKLNKLFAYLVLNCLLIPSINAQHIEYSKKLVDNKKIPTLLTFKKQKTYTSNQYKIALQKELQLSVNDDFKLLVAEQDDLGFTHQKLHQYYNGIRVENGIYKVHSKDGQIQSINGNFYKVPVKFEVKPLISESKALEVALNIVKAEQYAWKLNKAILAKVIKNQKED